jgi:hypothetical protein
MLNNSGTISIFMNNGDLSTYQIVLQAASNVMTALVNNTMTDTLVLVTMVFFIGELLLNYGNLKRVRIGNYAAIIGLYIFLFSKVVDVQIIQYNPINMAINSSGQSVYIKNMPFAPALMMKIIYDLDYNLKTVIDTAFYAARNMSSDGARGKFFDKVDEYTDLLSGNIHNADIALQYTSFLKNIVLPDLHTNLGNGDIGVIAGNDMANILAVMYGSCNNNNIAGLTDHSQETLFLVQEIDPVRGTLHYVINLGQLNNDIILNEPHCSMAKGDYFTNLKNDLSSYYDSRISNLSADYPDFLLSESYNNILAQAKAYSNGVDINQISSMKDLFTATIFNINTEKISGLYGARSIFDLTESSIESSTGAAVKAATLKIIVGGIIDVIILLFIFTFPVIFIASFFPNMLGVVKSYFISFFVLSFAGPLSYFLECISDVYTDGVFAMNLAGAAAGLSQRAQSGILNTYNAMPWVTTIVYGGAMAALFGLGSRTLNVIGEQLFQEATAPVTSNTASLLTDNMSFGNRSLGSLTAMSESGFSQNFGDIALRGFSMNRAMDFLAAINHDSQSLNNSEKSELSANGFFMDDKGRWSIKNDYESRMQSADYLRGLENRPEYTRLINEGSILNRSILNGLKDLSIYRSNTDVARTLSDGSVDKMMNGSGMMKLEGWKRLINEFASQKYQPHQDYSDSVSTTAGVNIPQGWVNAGLSENFSAGDNHSYSQSLDKLSGELFKVVRDINWNKSGISKTSSDMEIMKTIDSAIYDSKSITEQAKIDWHAISHNAELTSLDPVRFLLDRTGLLKSGFDSDRSKFTDNAIAQFLRSNDFDLK